MAEVVISKGRQVTIPAELLRTYGLKPGDRVIVVAEPEGIRILPKREKLAKIRALRLGKEKWEEIERDLDENCCL